MSFLTTTPEEIQAAARNLAAIREMLAQSSASAAAPTAGMVAAAQDQVSAQVAAFFSAYGQEYQVISAQAQMFHEQFVNLVNAGAGAYRGTEVAAQQNLINAVNAPVQGLLGQSAAASGGIAGAVASGLTAAQAGPLPLLGGGLGSTIGGVTPIGGSIDGIVTALRNGSAASLLPGQVEAVLQTLSGGIVGLPTGLTGLERALVPGLLAPAAGTGNAPIAGPHQTLYANTVADLQTLGGALTSNPAPFLHQLVASQIGYAQTIVAGAEYIIQNFPAILAYLPANIQAFVQAVLAFNPVPYVQEFIAHQMAYAQIIVTSLQNAAHDLGAGLAALPAAFQSAFPALQMGDITGAVTDVAQGFVNLFANGVDVTTIGNISVPPGITATVTPGGAVGDLLPIRTIPGMMAQDFTNLLSSGSIPAQISQNFTNVINTLDTSLTEQVLLTIKLLPLPPSTNFSVNVTAGSPVALASEALGAPYNAGGAASAVASQFVGQWQTGDFGGARGTVIQAPAVVTNALLHGQSMLPIGFGIGGYPPL